MEVVGFPLRREGRTPRGYEYCGVEIEGALDGSSVVAGRREESPRATFRFLNDMAQEKC